MIIGDRVCTGKSFKWYLDESRIDPIEKKGEGYGAGANKIHGYQWAFVPVPKSTVSRITFYGQCVYRGGDYCNTSLTLDRTSKNNYNNTMGVIQDDNNLEIPQSNLLASIEESADCGYTSKRNVAKEALNQLLCDNLKFLLPENPSDLEITKLSNAFIAALNASGLAINLTSLEIERIIKSNCNEAVVNGILQTISDDAINTSEVLEQLEGKDLFSDIVDKLNQTIRITTETTQPSCGLPDGSITITATGGTGQYSYSIDGGATFTLNKTLFDGLTAGTYNIVVKDNLGNEASKTIELEEAEAAVISEPEIAVAARLATEIITSGAITTRFSDAHTAHTFTLSSNVVSFEWKPFPANELKITAYIGPEKEKIEGKTFTALFSKNNPNVFLGFYNLAYNKAGGCTSTIGVCNVENLKGGTCEEGYLPRHVYDANNTDLVKAFISNYSAQAADPKYQQALALIKKLEPLGLIKVRDHGFIYLTLDEVLKALQATDQALQNNLTALNSIINTGDRCTLLYTLWALRQMPNSTAVYQSLALAERKAALKKLADGNLTTANIDEFWCSYGNGGEESVIKLLKTTGSAEYADVLNYLKQQNNVQGKSLLNKFVDDIHNVFNESFNEFIAVVSTMSLEAFPRPAKELQEYYAEKTYIHFNDNWLGNINTYELSDANVITLGSRKFITGSNETYNVTTDPYDYLLVTFENNFEMGGSSFTKGNAYILPGIFVYGLFNKSHVEKWKTTGEAAAMTALTLVGVSEIAAAVRAGSASGFILGTVDVGLGLGDVVLSIAFKNEVEQIYPGLAEAWSKIAMCYGIGRLAGVGLEALYKKAYVESYLASYDFRISTNAKQTAGEAFTQLDQNVPDLSQVVSSIKADVVNLQSTPWVEGRSLSAEGVNMEFITTAQIRGYEPYPPYEALTTVEDVKFGVGRKLYCVESETQAMPGGWMGQVLFDSEAEAREVLAILPEFKPIGETLVIREYEVIQPINVRSGIAGSQTSPSTNQTYSGGGTQIQLLFDTRSNWKNYFKAQKIIEGSEAIREYVRLLK